MNLTLSPGILDEIVEDAKRVYPKEGCGLITGVAAEGRRFISILNVAESPSEFEMDPVALIRELKSIRNAGEELVAIYHSHPHGPAAPSAMDIHQAYYPQAAHLIVSLADLKHPQTAAFRITGQEVIAIEVHAIV